MRFRPTFLVAVLCAASLGVVHAQQVSVTSGSRVQSGASKVPNGVSFAYDAQQGQISATGIQLDTSKPKSNNLSPTTGTVDVTINIKPVSKFGKETAFRCSVYIIGGVIDTTNGVVEGGIETVNGWGKAASGGGATCTLSIPYSWVIVPDPAATAGAILAYAVAAVKDGRDDHRDDHREVLRSTLQVDGIEPLPPSGTTSTFAFDVVL